MEHSHKNDICILKTIFCPKSLGSLVNNEHRPNVLYDRSPQRFVAIVGTIIPLEK